MIRPYKIIPFIAIVLTILSGFSTAAPASPDRPPQPEGIIGGEFLQGQMMSGNVPPPMGVPVEMIARGNGFAFQDDESHLLKLNIVRLSPLEPAQVIDLLISNKSIDEIKEAIQAKEGQTTYRGNMKLDRVVYPLTDIFVDSPDGNIKLIEANAAAPTSFDAAQMNIVGHLNLTISSVQGGEIGEGRLDIESAEHSGSYKLLLDMAGHPMPAQARGDRERPSDG
jgi:hypothetical protein